ncbi:MAG: hypothetical protein V7756_04745 [Halopseudomonas sp.]|uniref:hypothetical protein n=1 Tax=Halopseudomonas sp. TaxID=2901191 RepID=UPI003001CB4C
MNQQDIVLAVSIGICALAYLFGMLTGRVVANEKHRQLIEPLRNQVFKQRRIAHEHEQRCANLQAEVSSLRAQLTTQRARTKHERYTLLRAGHELRLAGQTFAGLQSIEHAATAQTLSTELLQMANAVGDPDWAEKNQDKGQPMEAAA